MNNKTILKLFLPLLMIMFMSATCRLSLSGTQIPVGVNTITINYFPNQSNFVAPTLSQTFTEALKDKFLRESNLTLADERGDWELNGAITRYISTPIAPTGNETTALNRLSITIKVDFVSRLDEKENWSESFVRFEDYESTKTLSQVEGDLLPKLSEQLADDIYQKLTQNW